MSYTPPPSYYPQGNPGYPQPGYPPPGYPPPGHPPGGMPPAAPQEPRRYSMFHGYVLFFSPSLWRDAGQRWGGIGFWFLFLLIVASWVPAIIHMSAGFSKWVRDDAPKLTSQVPPITISNGVVSTPVQQPYTITDPESGRPLVVIDTTGATTAPPPTHPSLLLTRNSLVQRENAHSLKTHDLSQVQSFYLDSKKAMEYLDMGKTLLWVAFFPAGILYSLVWRLLFAVILAAIGTAVASGSGARVTFAGAMRLAAISMVPMIVVDAVTCPIGFSPGCWWLILEIGAPLVLFIFMVKANAPQAGPGGPWGAAPQQPWQYPAAPATMPAWQPPPAPPQA